MNFIKSLKPLSLQLITIEYTKTTLESNLFLLKNSLELSEIEIEILAISTFFDQDDNVTKLSTFTSEMVKNIRQLIKFIAALTDYPINQISNALSSESPIVKTGLIELSSSYHIYNDISDIITPSHALKTLFHQRFDSEEALLSLWLVPLSASQLKLKNFHYLEPNISQIQSYLYNACKQRQKGVNIFLYGQPGTGKSELSRLLAGHDMTVYGVHYGKFRGSISDNDSKEKTNRLRYYLMAQQLLKRKNNCILVLDEAEDIFGLSSSSIQGFLSGLNDKKAVASVNKSWMNQMLEENAVPTIWVSNHIDQVDPAFLRRYDFLIEVPIPPKMVRYEIIQSYLQPFQLPHRTIAFLAEQRDLPPAIFKKCTKVIQNLSLQSPPEIEVTLLQQINNWRKTAELPLLHPPKNTKAKFDPDLLNIQPSAQFFQKILTNDTHAKLCFYGSSGTGKTAFANHLSKYLDRPLITCRASEMISPKVGKTEQNIAKLFQEAKQEQSILFFDEGDSLLRDRQHAQHSWEVTQVNEFLTQMDNFDGTVFLATNQIEQLDPAVLRRFDFKVAFQPFNFDQAWHYFCQICSNSRTEHQEQLKELMQSTSVTIGHFVNINRQFMLAKQPPNAEMIFQLIRSLSS